MENRISRRSKGCILVRRDEIEKTLKSEPSLGKKLLEPFKSFSLANSLPFNILEDKDLLINDAEVHMSEGDLWLCLEGEVQFIYGGEMINPQPTTTADGKVDEGELKAKKILGGKEVVLKPGDWLWIPAGEPHQHICSGVARLIIIKIPLT